MSISVLAGIREYLSGCPLFDNGLIRVNYLEGEPIAYTVDEGGEELIAAHRCLLETLQNRRLENVEELVRTTYFEDALHI